MKMVLNAFVFFSMAFGFIGVEPLPGSSFQRVHQSPHSDPLPVGYKLTRLLDGEKIALHGPNHYELELKKDHGIYIGLQSIAAYNVPVKVIMKLMGSKGQLIAQAESKFIGYDGDNYDFSGWTSEIRLSKIPESDRYTLRVFSAVDRQPGFVSTGEGDYQLAIWQN